MPCPESLILSPSHVQSALAHFSLAFTFIGSFDSRQPVFDSLALWDFPLVTSQPHATNIMPALAQNYALFYSTNGSDSQNLRNETLVTVKTTNWLLATKPRWGPVLQCCTCIELHQPCVTCRGYHIH
jgi:hypothetical protein